MSVSVLVNAQSRHGSEAMGQRIRAAYPEARVRVTRTLDEARQWVRTDLDRTNPGIVLCGGGDGTAISLLRELREHDVEVDAFGLLPLGTGNAWARATGRMGERAVMRGLGHLRRTSSPPVRGFSLVEVDGHVTPFAGAGWDAEILADYKKFQCSLPRVMRGQGSARFSYLASLATRTLPRHMGSWRAPRVRIVNTGEWALRVDAQGEAVPVEDGGPGALLYEGPLGVGGAATTEHLGLGFRAFRFAHLVPGRMAVRVYSGTPVQAARHLPALWRGEHPVPNDHLFMLTKCRFEFDRAVPYEIGGDLAGEKREIDFSLSTQAVNLIDWRALDRAA